MKLLAVGDIHYNLKQFDGHFSVCPNGTVPQRVGQLPNFQQEPITNFHPGRKLEGVQNQKFFGSLKKFVMHPSWEVLYVLGCNLMFAPLPVKETDYA